MIPGNAFKPGPAPASALIPAYLFGTPIIISYREGTTDDFDAVDQDPPLSLITVNKGPFSAEISAGPGVGGFGLRVDLIRNGVYGTLLVDTINADIELSPLNIEYCPDTTEETEELSASVDLTSVESCPPASVVVEDVGSPLSNLVTDDY